MSGNGESDAPPLPIIAVMDLPTQPAIDADAAYRALLARDARLDGRLVRRRHVDGRLLPADLPRPHAATRELPLLRHAGPGRGRRLPALPEVPARDRPRPGLRLVGDGRVAHARPPGRAVARRARPRGRRRRSDEPRRARAPSRRERPPRAAHLRRRARRHAAAVRADAPPAARQAVADRHGDADLAGRARERLSQPAPLQRGVRRELPADAERGCAATRRRTRRAPTTPCCVTLAFREPLAREALLRFLAQRAIPGVEQVDAGALRIRRTRAPRRRRRREAGWIEASFVPQRPQLALALLGLARRRGRLAAAGGPALARPRRRPAGDRRRARRACPATTDCACRAASTRSSLPCGPCSASRSRWRRRERSRGASSNASARPSPRPGPNSTAAFPRRRPWPASGVDQIAELGIIRSRAAADHRAGRRLARAAAAAAAALRRRRRCSSACAPARHRPVDGALRRDARARLERRVPARRRGRAQCDGPAARRARAARGRSALAGLATLAFVRRAQTLEQPSWHSETAPPASEPRPIMSLASLAAACTAQTTDRHAARRGAAGAHRDRPRRRLVRGPEGPPGRDRRAAPRRRRPAARRRIAARRVLRRPAQATSTCRSICAAPSSSARCGARCCASAIGRTSSYGDIARERRRATGRARRRRRRGAQPGLGDRALPPRARQRRQPHRLCRRPAAQERAAAARRRACEGARWRRAAEPGRPVGRLVPLHAPGRRRVRARRRRGAARRRRVAAAGAAARRCAGRRPSCAATGGRSSSSASSIRRCPSCASPTRCCRSRPACRRSSTRRRRCSAPSSPGSG